MKWVKTLIKGYIMNPLWSLLHFYQQRWYLTFFHFLVEIFFSVFFYIESCLNLVHITETSGCSSSIPWGETVHRCVLISHPRYPVRWYDLPVSWRRDLKHKGTVIRYSKVCRLRPNSWLFTCSQEVVAYSLSISSIVLFGPHPRPPDDVLQQRTEQRKLLDSQIGQ